MCPSSIKTISLQNYKEVLEVKEKAIKGGGALLLRQLGVHLINIVGNIVLARILIPEDFGVYAIVTFLINFLVLFGDVGLGASLIQRTQEPTNKEIRSIFTFQQIVNSVIVIFAFIISPLIVKHYHLKDDAVWMIRLMVLTLILVSFRSMSAARIQRSLKFSRLVLVEIIESIGFQIATITLASLGFGAWSFIIGTIVKSIFGASLLLLISPWPIGVAWDWAVIKTVIKFGIPYQGVNFVALIKDAINPILIGTLLGISSVGYVTWATMLAGYPVLATSILHRLFFPTFSRLKNEREALSVAIEKVLRWNNIFVLSILAILITQAHEITEIVFGSKWLPALPLVYFLSFGDMFACSIPLMALLNALGKSHLNFIFTLIWMLSIWIFGYPLIKAYGLKGYGVAHMIIQFTNFIFYWKVKRLLSFRMLRMVFPSIGAFALAILFTFWLKNLVNIANPVTIILVALATIGIYCGGLFLFSGKMLVSEGMSLLKVLKGVSLTA